MKIYLSAKQVVARLNGAISLKLVYKLVQQGKLKGNRATGKLLIEEESLIALLEGGRAPPAPSPPAIKPKPLPKPKKLELW